MSVCIGWGEASDDRDTPTVCEGTFRMDWSQSKGRIWLQKIVFIEGCGSFGCTSVCRARFRTFGLQILFARERFGRLGFIVCLQEKVLDVWGTKV